MKVYFHIAEREVLIWKSIPQHSLPDGWDRGRDSLSYQSMKKTTIIILLSLLVTMRVSAQQKYYGDGIDDYLRFVPLATSVALKAAGVESASSWKRYTVSTAISATVALGTAYVLKKKIKDTRPDGTDREAFPSGHTTLAFLGAAVLDKEFRHVSPWISVAGYTTATAVAIDRVARNRHHWHDVAAGAAIGLGGTWLGYLVGDKITGEHSRWHVVTAGTEFVVQLDL